MLRNPRHFSFSSHKNVNLLFRFSTLLFSRRVLNSPMWFTPGPWKPFSCCSAVLPFLIRVLRNISSSFSISLILFSLFCSNFWFLHGNKKNQTRKSLYCFNFNMKRKRSKRRAFRLTLKENRLKGFAWTERRIRFKLFDDDLRLWEFEDFSMQVTLSETNLSLDADISETRLRLH